MIVLKMQTKVCKKYLKNYLEIAMRTLSILWTTGQKYTKMWNSILHILYIYCFYLSLTDFLQIAKNDYP